MNINFKQVKNGLIRTATLTTDDRTYFSILGEPVTYRGTNLMTLHLNDITTGLPMHFKANSEFYFKEHSDQKYRASAQQNLPTLTDEQWERGCPLYMEQYLSKMKCYEAEPAKAEDIRRAKHSLEFHQAYRPVDNNEIKQSQDNLAKVEATPLSAYEARHADRISLADSACEIFWDEIATPSILYWENLRDQALALFKEFDGQDVWLTDQPDADAEPWAEIDGEREPVEFDGYTLSTGDKEYKCFANATEAGKAAREYWVDMAENDAEEFVELVGATNLLKWAMGDYASPGTTEVDSFDAWFDLYLDPLGAAEQHASYDGLECDLTLSPSLIEEHGEMVVCYRVG